MSPEKKFDLGDYVEVRDRVKLFYELYAQGRLVTTEVRASTEPDGKPRIWVQAKAYRTIDDPLPGIGWSWMELPGASSYTLHSELENTETSAWGRAIGSLGILIERSIASSNEIASKAQPAPVAAPRPVTPKPTQPAPQPRSATPAQPATNEPPAVSDDELDSLVRSNTETLRPPKPTGMTFGELHPCKLHAIPTVEDAHGGWSCPECRPPR